MYVILVSLNALFVTHWLVQLVKLVTSLKMALVLNVQLSSLNVLLAHHQHAKLANLVTSYKTEHVIFAIHVSPIA